MIHVYVTKSELFSMILDLKARLDELEGKPLRGPITMREYRIACERGDKALMACYLAQEENRSCSRITKSSGPDQALQVK